MKLPVISSCGVLDGFPSSRLQCVTILKGAANQGHLPESSVPRVFTGTESHTAHIADLWSLVPLVCSKAPIINHTVRLSGGQTHPAKTHLSGSTFSGPRDHLPAAEGKGQISLWVKSIPHYTGEFYSPLL